MASISIYVPTRKYVVVKNNSFVYDTFNEENISRQSTMKAYLASKGVIASYKPLRRCEAIISWHDHVVFCGKKETAKKLAETMGIEKEELDGVLVPGFIDAHIHLDSLGLYLSTVRLEDVSSKKELIQKISSGTPIGGWIIARGFDHNLFLDEKKPPFRKELDTTHRDVPVLIVHKSGHMGVVNSAGLNYFLEKIGENEKIDPETGFIYEDALTALYNKIINELPHNTFKSLILRAEKDLYRRGIAAVGVAGCSWKCYEILEEMDRGDKHIVRTFVYLFAEDIEDLYRIAGKANYTWRSGNKLRVNGFKIILDGALGTRTAYLSSPYSDDPGNTGVLLYDKSKLEEIIVTGAKLGLQAAIHCIGDACLDIVLGIYSRIREYVEKLRYRIEHVSLVRDDQLPLIQSIKAILVVQPRFVISDKWIPERLGHKRIYWVYRFKTLSKLTWIAISTDSPVEPFDPIETMYAAVYRGANEGLIHGLKTINERLSVVETLHYYTRGSGYALSDDRLGCLEEGCYADPVLLNMDPLNIEDPRQLYELKINPVKHMI